MFKFFLIITGLFLSIFLISEKREVNMASTDPCSLSNHNEVTVSHWHLSISPPNFETKILTGKIRINAKVISDNATQLVMYII